jgi:hypothetical protein
VAGVLDRDLGHVALLARTHEDVDDALDEGRRVGDLAPGVELVRLPDPPGVLVGFGALGAHPEALDVEPLLDGVDDELAEVVREGREERAERLAELRGREGEPVLALVVRLVAFELGPRCSLLEHRVERLPSRG